MQRGTQQRWYPVLMSSTYNSVWSSGQESSSHLQVMKRWGHNSRAKENGYLANLQSVTEAC